MAEGHELPRAVWGHAPWKFFEMNMRCDAILRNVTVVFHFIF